MKSAFLMLIVGLGAACASTSPGPRLVGAQHLGIQWDELEGWPADDHVAAFATFVASCRAVKAGALAPLCERALSAGALGDAEARVFFETGFRLERINADDDAAGLITGYYVPVFAASRVRTPQFETPLYAAPSDAADLKYTRAEIENGALAGKGLEILWVHDPIDAFFAQVQGSARVQLQDGSFLKVEYAKKNEHPYTSIGRVLIERGDVSRSEMNMERLRTWMTENREAAIELRQHNESFVFFSVRPSTEIEQGSGAQGVPLVPGRSIAIDQKLYTYGTPFFINADLPIESAEPTTHFAHLMIAMDTGTAIIGSARADIYLGVGDQAAEIAGRFKQRGTFTLLVPSAE